MHSSEFQEKEGAACNGSEMREKSQQPCQSPQSVNTSGSPSVYMPLTRLKTKGSSQTGPSISQSINISPISCIQPVDNETLLGSS